MKKHDWWRMNSSKDQSGDIEYCLKQGLVRARVKNGQWVWRKVYNASDSIAVGFGIIQEEEAKLKNDL
jgi:hypothetical protein